MVYDARVRLRFATRLFVAALIVAAPSFPLALAQEDPNPQKVPNSSKAEPKYDQTFSGQIVQVTAVQITVSRSILGKTAEKRTFAIKTDTRIEGKLRVRARVTVGYVTGDDGDAARLIVVRTDNNKK